MSGSEQQADAVADLVVRIYTLHEIALKEAGGIEGLRDGALLHAAVARPFATFGGEDLYPGDFEKAAALFHSLIKSHPFMDGTKRIAFLSALYFLENRGYRIPTLFPKDEVIQFCLAVAEEHARQSAGEPVQPITVAEIAAWLRHLLRIEPQT
jgi:death on curing protein